jgi:hypothetical protein
VAEIGESPPGIQDQPGQNSKQTNEQKSLRRNDNVKNMYL